MLLALSGQWTTRASLAAFGHWLTARHGVLTLGQVVQGDLKDYVERRERFETTLRKFIARTRMRAFSCLAISENLSTGIQGMVQSQGIGGFRPNTVLLGWPKERGAVRSFGTNLRLIARLRKSVLCGRLNAERMLRW